MWTCQRWISICGWFVPRRVRRWLIRAIISCIIGAFAIMIGSAAVSTFFASASRPSALHTHTNTHDCCCCCCFFVDGVENLKWNKWKYYCKNMYHLTLELSILLLSSLEKSVANIICASTSIKVEEKTHQNLLLMYSEVHEFVVKHRLPLVVVAMN